MSQQQDMTPQMEKISWSYMTSGTWKYDYFVVGGFQRQMKIDLKREAARKQKETFHWGGGGGSPTWTSASRRSASEVHLRPKPDHGLSDPSGVSLSLRSFRPGRKETGTGECRCRTARRRHWKQTSNYNKFHHDWLTTQPVRTLKIAYLQIRN